MLKIIAVSCKGLVEIYIHLFVHGGKSSRIWRNIKTNYSVARPVWISFFLSNVHLWHIWVANVWSVTSWHYLNSSTFKWLSCLSTAFQMNPIYKLNFTSILVGILHFGWLTMVTISLCCCFVVIVFAYSHWVSLLAIMENWNQDHPERHSNFYGLYIKFQGCGKWPWTWWGRQKGQVIGPNAPVMESGRPYWNSAVTDGEII